MPQRPTYARRPTAWVGAYGGAPRSTGFSDRSWQTARVRLVHKLTVAFLAGSFAVLGANGVLRVRREVQFFENAAARDRRAIGGTLGLAISATWRAEGEARARALVDTAQRRQQRVRMRLLPLPALDAASREALQRDGALTRVEAAANDEQRVSWIPLDAPGAPAARTRCARRRSSSSRPGA